MVAERDEVRELAEELCERWTGGKGPGIVIHLEDRLRSFLEKREGELQSERDRWKEAAFESNETASALRGQIAALRGHLKSLIGCLESCVGHDEDGNPRFVVPATEAAVNRAKKTLDDGTGEKEARVLRVAQLTARAWHNLEGNDEPTRWRVELEKGCLPDLAAAVDALEASR